MKLFNIKENKIINLDCIIDSEGNQLIASVLDNSELVKFGYKRVIESEKPRTLNEFEYIETKYRNTSDTYNIEYIIKDMDIQTIREILTQRVKNRIQSLKTRSSIKVPGIGEVDTGEKYLSNIDALIEISDSLGKNINFRLADNSEVSIKPDQLKTIKKYIAQRQVELFNIKIQKIKEIESLKTLEQIKNYKIEIY